MHSSKGEQFTEGCHKLLFFWLILVRSTILAPLRSKIYNEYHHTFFSPSAATSLVDDDDDDDDDDDEDDDDDDDDDEVDDDDLVD